MKTQSTKIESKRDQEHGSAAGRAFDVSARLNVWRQNRKLPARG
jgi:hypothetical protein